MPAVSVLLPVRNGLPWLQEALEGLAAQTLTNLEILALEDGSTDGTSDFLAAWPDGRVRVIPTRGVGISSALNIGLAEAAAPFVARQDADDVSAPERLETQLRFLASHTNIGVLGAVAEYIDARGGPVDNEWVRTIRRQQDVAVTPEEIRELMPLTCCVTHGSVMARTTVLREAGGYRHAAAPAEDYDLWLRLLPRVAFAKIREPLYRYRVHDSQASTLARERQLLKTLTAKFEYVRRLFPRLPSPARLVVAGSGRGAACYRALAASHGFQTVPPPSALQPGRLELLAHPLVQRWTLECCDALVVADFAEIGIYTAALSARAAGSGAVRVGNFFIPERWARRQAA